MPTIDISKYKRKPEKPVRPSEDDKPFDILAFLNRDITWGNGQLPDRKKEEFYVEFSTLLLSGVDLKTAFDLVLLDQKQGKDNKLFQQVKADVLKGDSLSDAIRKTGHFSDYEFFSLRIGEETGKLGEVMQELAAFYKSKIAQRRKIISALTYPIIVLSTSVGAVLFMLKFVVPMFSDIFTRFGGELPAITAFILKVSQWMDRTFWWAVLLIGVTVVFIRVNRRQLWWRKWSAHMLLRMPLFGDIIRKVHLARFANTMRLLVSTNTPLLQSIQLVRQMTDFYPISHSLEGAEREILQGESLHAALARYPFYPAKLVQLIRVGEEVNRLDFFFDKIATQLTEEVEYKTATLSSLLEPFIVIFLGLVVGLILIAMYLPMFQMSNSF